MARYVALLGSINVGGNRLSMADLRHALEREDFSEVETVVASGNVLFEHDSRPSAGLAEKIAHVVDDRFGIASTVIVLTAAELAGTLAESPFGDGADNLVHVHFLTGQPEPEQFDRLFSDHAGRGNERLAAGTRALHVDFVDGVAASKLTGPFIDKRLGHPGTARNRRSITRIIEKMAAA